MISLALLIPLSAATEPAPCMTTAEWTDLGVFPASRNMPPLTPAFANWVSARFAGATMKVLLEEAMGYKMNPWVKYGGAGAFFDAVKDFDAGTLESGNVPDFMNEIWANGNEDNVRELSIESDLLKNFAGLGYTALISWFIPGYTASVTAANNGWDLVYWKTYLDQAVVDHFSATNLTAFILNDTSLHEKMNKSEPDSIFTPPQCENATCIDFISVSPEWDANFFQSQIRNLGLKARITYWDWNPWKDLTRALFASKRDFITYAWEPESLVGELQAVPIVFPKASDDCFETQNLIPPYLGLNSSIDCDYPRTQLLKLGRTKAFEEHPAAEELIGFISRFTLKKPDVEWFNLKYVNGSWADQNTDAEAFACAWIKDPENQEVWKPWISNDYVYGEKLSAETIALYCVGSVMVVLGLVFLMWKCGFMDGLEAVLFDMIIVYIGKIVMDLFDIMSDTMAYFYSVNGNPKIPLWFNIMYVIVLGASLVAGAYAVYVNACVAYSAAITRKALVEDDVDEGEMMKIRARSSLWQGSTGRPRASEIHKDDDLENIWTQEELEFAIKRINDCYVALAIAVTEDIPMLILNAYLMLNYPEDMTTFVYVSLFLSIFFMGVRLNQFYKIIMYRKQYEYAEKAHEIHARQHEIQKGIEQLAKKSDVQNV